MCAPKQDVRVLGGPTGPLMYVQLLWVFSVEPRMVRVTVPSCEAQTKFGAQFLSDYCPF